MDILGWVGGVFWILLGGYTLFAVKGLVARELLSPPFRLESQKKHYFEERERCTVTPVRCEIIFIFSF